jgi:phosphate transport system permease protein
MEEKMNPISERMLKNANTKKRKRASINRIMLFMTGVMVVLALIPLFWIIIYVFFRGSEAINLDFFTQLPTMLGQSGGGILHAIEGTLILLVISTFIAIPIGILTALYIVRHPNTLPGMAARLATDVLSGVPSIIIGIVCYAFIVKPQGHFSALAGGIALAILMLPIIIRTTEEMVKLVPADLREASLALGTPEWKTAISVILPAAMNGVITGFTLGIARASGETAPLLFTILGNEGFNISQLVRNGIAQGQNPLTIIGRIINSPVDSLPLTLFKYTSLPYPERVTQAWGVALVLLAIILLLNISAKVFILKREAKLKGK